MLNNKQSSLLPKVDLQQKLLNVTFGKMNMIAFLHQGLILINSFHSLRAAEREVVEKVQEILAERLQSMSGYLTERVDVDRDVGEDTIV